MSKHSKVFPANEQPESDGHRRGHGDVAMETNDALWREHRQLRNCTGTIRTRKRSTNRRIPISESYTLTDSIRTLCTTFGWRPDRSEAKGLPPRLFRSERNIPGAPPANVIGEAVSPTAIRVSWDPPPANRSNGRIVYYKLQYVEADKSDSEAAVVKLNATQFDLDELKRWTTYRIWVLAGTSVGDGPTSYPITVRTHEDVPGDPQDVKVTPLNSTTIKVNWKPPQSRNRNGIILGYHVHVQETKEEGKSYLNEPMKFDVVGDSTLELNVSGLQPDTFYTIQVAALTRKGDGDRSAPVTVRTPGGVPNRPNLVLKTGVVKTFSNLWGAQRLSSAIWCQRSTAEGCCIKSYRINDLERGVEYEFRVAGQNHIGIGQEAIKYMHTLKVLQLDLPPTSEWPDHQVRYPVPQKIRS
ncbi:unnamed protein product [Callosobruchus maculatus]|uniref:Fibronectin type-III domain-containing protein n=1 Tax=Callosobruchus maculatus TaxID=64391 RepID=A0A653C7P6_CALMS|nr:unnamed protein product [Callosobruchus maculatus]